LNNPLSYTDPLGLNCVWDDGSYDSEHDPDTGSPAQCQAKGGTWIELGQDDSWNSDPNTVFKDAVAQIQSGNWNIISVTGANGAPNITVYADVVDTGNNLVARTAWTDTNGTITSYAYQGGNVAGVVYSSTPDSGGVIAQGFANWVASNSVDYFQDPVWQLANQISFYNYNLLGTTPQESMCVGAGLALSATAAAYYPGAGQEWFAYGLANGGGFLTLAKC
jgi:hypothetical protein